MKMTEREIGKRCLFALLGPAAFIPLVTGFDRGIMAASVYLATILFLEAPRTLLRGGGYRNMAAIAGGTGFLAVIALVPFLSNRFFPERYPFLFQACLVAPFGFHTVMILMHEYGSRIMPDERGSPVKPVDMLATVLILVLWGACWRFPGVGDPGFSLNPRLAIPLFFLVAGLSAGLVLHLAGKAADSDKRKTDAAGDATGRLS